MQLLPHPDFPAPGGIALEAEAAWTAAGDLRLRYRLHGLLAALALPARQASERGEGLWRHTCFEAFFQGDDVSAYTEVNLAPSRLWQVYRFRDYRVGGPLETAARPEVDTALESSALILVATLPAAWIPPGPRLRIGLTAVLEDAAGALSYWSLAHPPGKPDFHDTRGLVLQLPRP